MQSSDWSADPTNRCCKKKEGSPDHRQQHPGLDGSVSMFNFMEDQSRRDSSVTGCEGVARLGVVGCPCPLSSHIHSSTRLQPPLHLQFCRFWIDEYLDCTKLTVAATCAPEMCPGRTDPVFCCCPDKKYFVPCTRFLGVKP